jgi:hypothetical protein
LPAGSVPSEDVCLSAICPNAMFLGLCSNRSQEACSAQSRFLQKGKRPATFSFPTAARMRSFPHCRTLATTPSSPSCRAHATAVGASITRSARRGLLQHGGAAPSPIPLCSVPHVPSVAPAARPVCSCPAPPSLLLHLLRVAPADARAPASLYLSLLYRPFRSSSSTQPARRRQ